MASDADSSKITQRIRQYKWYPILPLVALLALFFVFMPSAPTPFNELGVHQQAISLSTFPTLIVTIYWFAKANGLAEKRTPEERILNDE